MRTERQAARSLRVEQSGDTERSGRGAKVVFLKLVESAQKRQIDPVTATRRSSASRHPDDGFRERKTNSSKSHRMAAQSRGAPQLFGRRFPVRRGLTEHASLSQNAVV
jgi:hypothetical protein